MNDRALSGRRLVVVAPDKFKGTMSAAEVADVIARELRLIAPSYEVVERPLADGGEGSVDLAIGLGMSHIHVVVTGPLGEPVQASYARDGTTAVVEMAQAAGLTRVAGQPDGTSAGNATTHGVGQLMAHAIAAGAHKIILGLGGSATTDGGAGLAHGLGAILHTASGQSWPRGGRWLGDITEIELQPMLDRLAGVEVVLATDVNNPLVGADGAAAVYGPQKGASAELVCQLDDNLRHWVNLLRMHTGVDVGAMAGAGAAGGTGAPLLAASSARIESGVGVMMQLAGFEDLASKAELVIVGEGSLDQQSLRGKGPVGTARLAKALGARVVAVVGRNTLTADDAAQASIDEVYAMTDIETDPVRCMRRPEPILQRLTSHLAAEELSLEVRQ